MGSINNVCPKTTTKKKEKAPLTAKIVTASYIYIYLGVCVLFSLWVASSAVTRLTENFVFCNQLFFLCPAVPLTYVQCPSYVFFFLRQHPCEETVFLGDGGREGGGQPHQSAGCQSINRNFPNSGVCLD